MDTYTEKLLQDDDSFGDENTILETIEISAKTNKLPDLKLSTREQKRKWKKIFNEETKINKNKLDFEKEREIKIKILKQKFLQFIIEEYNKIYESIRAGYFHTPGHVALICMDKYLTIDEKKKLFLETINDFNESDKYKLEVNYTIGQERINIFFTWND